MADSSDHQTYGGPDGYNGDSRRSRSPDDRDRGRPDDRDRGRAPPARDSGAEAVNPGNNLHISGLSSRVEDRDLEAVFSKFGRLTKASVMKDPHTGESRGFGFVTFEKVEDADAAVAALNATELLGRTMTVQRAKRGRARTPTPGQYQGPPKRDYHSRPYEPRGYSDDRRGSKYDRNDRYDDRRGDRYDDRRNGGGGGGYDRDRYDDKRYERDDRRGSYEDRRGSGYDDRRYGTPQTAAPAPETGRF